MRVRTQTILAITPIFAVMGIAIGLLVYTSERSEVKWGIEEEALSLGIAISEFVDGDRFVREMTEKKGFSQGDQLKAILAHGQLKRVRLYRLEGAETTLLWETGLEESGVEKYDPPGNPAVRELAAALDAQAWVSPVLKLDSGVSVVKALVPVRGNAGQPVALLEVITDAGRLKARSDQMVRRIIEMTLALSGVGILLSIGVSGFLTRRLGQLDEAAKIVASGDYAQEIDLRTIREVNDLSSTFNTMKSVLSDVVDRAKKTLVEAEQFRNPADLATTCRELGEGGVRRQIGCYEVLLRTSGESPSGAFTGIFEQDGMTCFILGRVREADPLEATIKANAALNFILKFLESESPDATLTRAAQMFEFEVCAILEHREGETLNGYQIPEDFLPGSTLECGQDVPIVITTARQTVAGKIWRFIESAGNIGEREIDLLMEGEVLASFLVIQSMPNEPGQHAPSG